MSNNIIVFSQSLAQEYISSNDPFPVDFDDAWQWLDYARKDTAKRAFDKCGFTENLDYQSFRQTVEREIGATVKEVIKLSVECFKTWAMMAGTEKGKQVRRYFLECEKIAKSKAIAVFDIPKTYGEALLLAGKLEMEKLALAAKIEQDAPLVQYAEAVQYSESSVEFHEFAKIIKNHGGRNTIMKKCREMGLLMKNSTLPYQKYVDAGYFEVTQELQEYEDNLTKQSKTRLVPYTLVTGKGQIWLHQKLIAFDNGNKQVIKQGVLSLV